MKCSVPHPARVRVVAKDRFPGLLSRAVQDVEIFHKGTLRITGIIKEIIFPHNAEKFGYNKSSVSSFELPGFILHA
jgi:hypothetical protein